MLHPPRRERCQFPRAPQVQCVLQPKKDSVSIDATRTRMVKHRKGASVKKPPQKPHAVGDAQESNALATESQLARHTERDESTHCNHRCDIFNDVPTNRNRLCPCRVDNRGKMTTSSCRHLDLDVMAAKGELLFPHST